MTPALAARVAQLDAEREHRAAVAEFRARRIADEQARIGALLTELVAVLAQLPLDADAWPNGHARRNADPWAEGSTATAEGWSGDIPF